MILAQPTPPVLEESREALQAALEEAQRVEEFGRTVAKAWRLS